MYRKELCIKLVIYQEFICCVELSHNVHIWSKTVCLEYRFFKLI